VNEYTALIAKQRKESNAFPIFWAFNQQQFNEGLEKFNCTQDQLTTIPGGGFIRKTDEADFIAMIEKHKTELTEAINADRTGNGFIFDMFNYELANHEYCITLDLTDALLSLGLTDAEIVKSKPLQTGLKKATDLQLYEDGLTDAYKQTLQRI